MTIRRIIFCLIILPFTFGPSYGQISKKSFFKNSRLGLGLNFSCIPSDSVYDLDIGRFLASYSYNIKTTPSVDTKIGAKYTVRGGKSFNDDVYMAIGYLDFPIIVSKRVSDGFWLGGGIQPSALLFEKIKYRGIKLDADPGIFSRLPSKTDLSAVLSTEIKMSQRSRFSLSASYSMLTSDRYLSQLNFLSFEGQLSFSLGRSIENISTKVNKVHLKDLAFTELESGVILVVLSKKEKLIAYYKEKGDLETANSLSLDVKEKNEGLINAFKSKFSFCKVMFIYSDVCSNAQRGDLSVSIFDAEKKVITIQNLSGAKYVFLRPGSIYGKTNALNRTGYYFEDEGGQRLDEPYPSLNSLGSMAELNINQLVFRLDKRLKGRSEDIKTTKHYQKNQRDLLSQPVEE